MRIQWRISILVLAAWLAMSGVCLAKNVYLKDGGIVACESFWRRGDQVVVKVNRDVVIELDIREIDQKKTFAVRKKRARHASQHKNASAMPASGEPVPAPARPAVVSLPSATPLPAPSATRVPATAPVKPAVATQKPLRTPAPSTTPLKAEAERPKRPAPETKSPSPTNASVSPRKPLQLRTAAAPPAPATNAAALLLLSGAALLVVIVTIVLYWKKRSSRSER